MSGLIAAAAVAGAAAAGYSAYQAHEAGEAKEEARAEAKQRAKQQAQQRKQRREKMETQQERAFRESHKKDAVKRRQAGKGGGVSSTLLTSTKGANDVDLGSSSLLGQLGKKKSQ